MMFRFSSAASALLLVFALAGTAQAQTNRFHFGPRLSYQFDLENVGLGVQLGAPIARHLEFYPSFDYFFVSNGTFWNANADIKYRLPIPATEWLYIGGGLNIARHGGAGLNLLAGVESLRGSVHPFGELRLTSNGRSSMQIAAGLNLTLGRHGESTAALR